jgi:hypothetical protein|tara:strand:+ start:5118 stop:5447 length:330 start_codon:yes stop_codon:yes gene_type:complete
MDYEITLHSIWRHLPDDSLKEILSYGDPVNTLRYKYAMDQLLYYAAEFNYHRTNHFRPFCRWYDVLETDYYRYALREVFLKKHVNEYYGSLNINYHSNTIIFHIKNNVS